MVTLRGQVQSAQAYVLVDVDSIEDEELRKDILLDASEGGGIYGIRIVEESVNGSARAPIYGYYRGTPQEDAWKSAKEKLGFDAEDVDDAEVRGGGLEITDSRREAALREQADESAATAAQRQRATEDADVAQITGGDTKSNITDETLDTKATNRADDPKAAAAAEDAALKAGKDASKASPSTTNKAPK